jgi:outer membrane protein assembly factor BamB
VVWYCVRRYDLSGKAAPFPDGRGHDKSMLIVSQKNQVTGIAVTDSEMYVSEGDGNKVYVYDKNTMKLLRSFAVPHPQEIAIDKKGSLWVIQGEKDKTPGKVLHYSKDGKELTGTINAALAPSAIAFDNQGRLLVADNSRNQQILIYNITNNPKLVTTLGTKGGIFSGTPGEVGDLKFAGISGVGSDGNGNIYVANNGFNESGTDIRKFSPNGKMQWRLLGLNFIDNADVDPSSDGTSVFTKEERFVMDYSKPPGKQWKYQGYTVNPFKYPQDPRLTRRYDATVMRRVQGKSLMFLKDMYGGSLLVYRFNKATDGEIAIPSTWFVGSSAEENEPAIGGDYPPHEPASGEWIWRDQNGNGTFDANEYDRSKDYPYIGGWWVDSKGDVWKALRTQDGMGIRRYRFGGFDRYGNPIYSYKKMEKQKHPSIFTDLRRIEYFPETDTMYLSGFTKENPAINQDYSKSIGSEIARFDNWSRGNLQPSWRIVLPTDKSAPPEVLPPAAMSVAGDYVFVTTVKTWEVYVYETKTGKLVQKLKPGTEVSGELGWVDIAYGIRAFRRSNGEYLVFVEEDFKGKVIMYQFKK